MLTSSIGSGSPAVTQTKATTRGMNDLSAEDFFRMLITELQTQDPMKPMDNQQLMSQLATMRQMEQSTTLNDTLKTLAAEQRFGATAGLIGHYVAGSVTDASGRAYEIQGLVIGVRFNEQGEAILELHNGNSLPASKVEQVTLVENLPPDIRRRLAEELGQTNGTSNEGEDGAEDGEGEGDGSDSGSVGESGSTGDDSSGDGSSSATARAIMADAALRRQAAYPTAIGAGTSLRGFAGKVNTTASVVDALARL